MKVMDLWSLREKLIQSINHSLFGNAGFLKSSLHSVKIGTENVQGQLYRAYFKVKWKPLCLLSFKYFGNAQNLLEDLKIEEYDSTGEYFTALAEAFSNTNKQRCASINI